MKKRFIILFAVISLLTFSENGLSLEDREVYGENKTKQKENVELQSEIDEDLIKKRDNIDIEMIEEELDPFEDIDKLDDIETASVGEEEELDYDIKIYDEDSVIRENPVNAGNESSILFGAGGYENIDSFKYVIDFSREYEEDETSYLLHLGREIDGLYRDNSKRSVDNYLGKIWYKRFSLQLSHLIIDEKLPGIENASSVVTSYNEIEDTNASLGINIWEDDTQSLKAEVSGGYKDNKSPATLLREYDTRNYKANIAYEKYIANKNFNDIFNFNTSYLTEDFGNNNNSVIGVEGKNLIKLRNLGLDIEAMLLYQQIQIENNNDVDSGLSGFVKATKSLQDEYNVGVKVEKENKYKTIKEIFTGNSFDQDIISVNGSGEILSDLDIEDKLIFEVSGEYTSASLNAGAYIRHNSVSNMIAYQEDSTTLTDEVVLTVDNISDDRDWQEVELDAKYKYEKLIANINYLFSNIEEVPFAPSNTLKASLEFVSDNNSETNVYKGKVQANYYSSMYGDVSETIELDGFYTVDILNTYKLNPSVELGFNVYNVSGNDTEFKSGYPLADRKFMLEVKLYY